MALIYPPYILRAQQPSLSLSTSRHDWGQRPVGWEDLHRLSGDIGHVCARGQGWPSVDRNIRNKWDSSGYDSMRNHGRIFGTHFEVEDGVEYKTKLSMRTLEYGILTRTGKCMECYTVRTELVVVVSA